jgi:hypothetical protein
LVSYHSHLKGFTLFDSSDKIAGFEKPLLIFHFITQERDFSNAMDEINRQVLETRVAYNQ